MALNIAALPTTLQPMVQDGVLEGMIHKALRPALPWRRMSESIRHPGAIGEKVTKTRLGLIPPEDEAALLLAAGGDPTLATESLEQFSYQVRAIGKSLLVELPADKFAHAAYFAKRIETLVFMGAQSMGRIARTRILEAYGGGDTFTTDNSAGAVTTVNVEDATGFAEVLDTNGVPQTVSVTNPLPITIDGDARLVTGSDTTVTPNTLTISVSYDYDQYDRVLRDDAAKVIRQGGRTTDRAIVAGDTATLKTFRDARTHLLNRNNRSPITGEVGGPFPCFISNDIENALYADAEFRDGIEGGISAGPFASAAIGTVAGIQFIPINEVSKLSGGNLQTTIHQSIMWGEEPLVEAYVPEVDLDDSANNVGGIAQANHFKMQIDPALALVVRAPLDALGHSLTASWVANFDYCVPTDTKDNNGAERVKRAVLVKCAGPA